VSTAISFPRALRKAFVHAVLRGLRFFTKFFWHFDRQKRKTCSRARSQRLEEGRKCEEK
jgi:hypothetical protein